MNDVDCSYYSSTTEVITVEPQRRFVLLCVRAHRCGQCLTSDVSVGLVLVHVAIYFIERTGVLYLRRLNATIGWIRYENSIMSSDEP